MSEFKYGSYGYIAETSLAEGKSALTAGIFGLAGQASQHAAECILKQYLKECLPEQDNSLLKSHSLRRLIAACPELKPLVSTYGFLELQSLYFDTRYPGDDFWELDERSATAVFASAESLFTAVKAMILAARSESDKRCNTELNRLDLNK